MTWPRFWTVSAKLAWQNLKGSSARAAFIAITLALSIAGVGGVYSAASVTRTAFEADRKSWLAADLAVDLTDPIAEQEAEAIERRTAEGIDWTLMSTTLTTASSDNAADPAIIAVKAIDPAKYPFYGSITLSPGLALGRLVNADSAAVSPDVAERLDVHIGDTIRIGAARFRVSAVVLIEPDRLSGGLGLGMRCILSREGYLRSGIELSGNSVKNRLLVRLPPAANVDRERLWLGELFPGGSVRDYRGAFQKQTEIAISFLGTTAFLALALGAIGASASVRQFAEQCIPTLAILRMLGAHTRQLFGMFLLQIAVIAAAAIAVALPLAWSGEIAILRLAGKYIGFASPNELGMGALLWSVCAGLAVMAPVLARPSALIRNLKPVILQRYELEERTAGFRVRGKWETWVYAVIAAAAFAVTAWKMLRAWNSAVLLAGSFLITAGLAYLMAAGFLKLAKKLPSRLREPILRHGVAGLDRQNYRSRTLITALAVSFAIMIATFAASGALTETLSEMLPYDHDALYVAGFKDTGAEKLKSFLERQPHVVQVQILTEVRLNLRSLDTPTVGLPHFAVCDPSIGRTETGLAGLVMDEDVAHRLGAATGARFEFETRDGTGEAELAKIRRLDAAERTWSTVRLDCNGINEASLFHYAAIVARPGDEFAVRREILAHYPTLAVMTAHELSDTVSATAEDAMKLARIVTWYAIGAGLCVLIAAVSSSQAARLQEIGILSAVGARPKTIFLIYTIEFAAIGLAAGTIGALSSYGFASVATSVISQHVQLFVDWKPAAAAVFCATILTVIGGWLPAYRLLNRKPMDALRRGA